MSKNAEAVLYDAVRDILLDIDGCYVPVKVKNNFNKKKYTDKIIETFIKYIRQKNIAGQLEILLL